MLQINKNIKLIRELSGKKQGEFAKLIKTNLSNLKTYENSSVRPKANVVAAICDYAGITAEDLENRALTHKDVHLPVDKVEDDGKAIGPGAQTSTLPGSATLQDLLNEKDQRIRDIEDNKRKMELLLAEAHKEKMVLMETLQANQRIQEIQLKAIESNLTKGQSEIKNLMYTQNKYWEDVLLVNPGLLVRSQGAAEGKKDISVSGEQAGSENKGRGRSGAGGK